MKSKGFTQDFLSQITNLKNSYLLCLATVYLMNQEEAITLLKNGTFQTGSYSFHFANIASLIENSRNSKNNPKTPEWQWEYLMFSTRSLFVYLYEAFKGDSLRFSTVKELDWFVFLANVRNSVAHGIDAVWNINKFNKTEIIYIRKSDHVKIKIEENWDKTPMKFEQIGGWPTVIDLLVFVEEETKRLTKTTSS